MASLRERGASGKASLLRINEKARAGWGIRVSPAEVATGIPA